VATAMRHVGHMLELAGHPDPRRLAGGKDLSIVLSRQLKSYRNEDPSSESQILALPVKIFTNICDNKGTSPNPLDQAAADITMIMFYFLLQVGEITCPEGNRARRTVQFRQKDTSFWTKTADGSLHWLPATASLQELLAADQVTMKLTNPPQIIGGACHALPSTHPPTR
jgi:hypothetical protein